MKTSVPIEGSVRVTPTLVRLEAQLPALVSEESVKRVLEREFDARIARPTNV